VVLGNDAFKTEYLPQAEASMLDLYRDSVLDSAAIWGNGEHLARLFDSGLKQLQGQFADIEPDHLANYVHDLVIYDRERSLNAFLADSARLAELYKDTEHRRIALRTLCKTYWIKDEVHVSHLMVSPIKTWRDRQAYGHLGSDYRIVHLNRPEFEVFGRRVAFEFSPKTWMLKLMRHQRWIRKFQAGVHRREHDIATRIRHELLENPATRSGDVRRQLMRLDNIKGYRQVRYDKAARVFENAEWSSLKTSDSIPIRQVI
jgi:indolepyruvate ferredoxin oxidoreductase